MSAQSTTSAETRTHLVFLVEGTRTPFMRSNGAFASLMAHDLARFAINGLLNKVLLEPKNVQHVAMGIVISDPNTSNVAREAVLGSMLPNSTAAHSCTMACISANRATTSICDMIRLGQIDIGIAGGVETFSDPPIRLSKGLRQMLSRFSRAKTFGAKLALARKLSLKDLAIDVPSPKEHSTGQLMGEGCERMIRRIGVTRQESDAFAKRSHDLAAQAWTDGHYAEDVVPVDLPPKFTRIDRDDGPRAGSSMEQLAKLPPAFEKPAGINTAASASFFSDGAGALLLASQNACHEHNLKPLARIVDYVYAGADPLEELLMGPAKTIPLLLDRAGLTFADVDVWELHEAFASQIVANIKALKEEGHGEIPLSKLNLWGGSLSLGHPFGATGARLLMTAARRLHHENARYAVVSGCAAGALGSAILLERA